jgi:hypothetical protein
MILTAIWSPPDKITKSAPFHGILVVFCNRSSALTSVRFPAYDRSNLRGTMRASFGPGKVRVPSNLRSKTHLMKLKTSDSNEMEG